LFSDRVGEETDIYDLGEYLARNASPKRRSDMNERKAFPPRLLIYPRWILPGEDGCYRVAGALRLHITAALNHLI
jgi:hypothetical protein